MVRIFIAHEELYCTFNHFEGIRDFQKSIGAKLSEEYLSINSIYKATEDSVAFALLKSEVVNANMRPQFKCGNNSKNISKALNLRLQFESGYNSCAAVNGAGTVYKKKKFTPKFKKPSLPKKRAKKNNYNKTTNYKTNSFHNDFQLSPIPTSGPTKTWAIL